ncbi:zinc finger protein 239-like [Rhincodon typus]|uniref:zinc finger protein 239-like n=1 Tax=Rhincodon typus TaxID=259920 RepID=UPI0009A3AC77|nr:zinc finger protein 239-like [Rhincodon typus]
MEGESTVHSGEKPYMSPVRGQGFRQSSGPLKHRCSHVGEKIWKTGNYEETFSYISDLEIHQHGHTEKWPFICSTCGKGFTQSFMLLTHQQVHTDPYKCQRCGNCYKCFSELISHVCVHTDERPLKCSVCGKCFKSSRELISNQSVQTEKRQFKSSHCGTGFS